MCRVAGESECLVLFGIVPCMIGLRSLWTCQEEYREGRHSTLEGGESLHSSAKERDLGCIWALNVG